MLGYIKKNIKWWNIQKAKAPEQRLCSSLPSHCVTFTTLTSQPNTIQSENAEAETPSHSTPRHSAGQCAPALHAIIHLLQKVQVEVTSYQKCSNQFSGKYFRISSPLCTKDNKKSSGIVKQPSKSQGQSNDNKWLNDKTKLLKCNITGSPASYQGNRIKNTLKDISSPMRQEIVY